MDIESTSPDPMQAEIVGFSFATEANAGWYIPVQYPEKEKTAFQR